MSLGLSGPVFLWGNILMDILMDLVWKICGGLAL